MSTTEKSRRLVNLGAGLRKGTLSSRAAKREIDDIEASYEHPFSPTIFTAKPKPWDRAYLKELEDGIMFGKTSRAYLEHFVDVSKEVYMRRNILRLIGELLLLLGFVAVLIRLIAWFFAK